MKKTGGAREWIVPAKYNYSKSSEENYCTENAQEVGKYGHIRSQLDYTYHKHYTEERQLLHDQLIDLFLKTRVLDSELNIECEAPLENWIVFTAGPMGAGKGHTMQWLNQHGLFPMDAFVNVDPDALRQLLPETAQYNAIDNNLTGYLTQKEVNYISEVLSYHSLEHGKNVLVDGSLRNAHWYLEYFRNLRARFPIIKIAIINVTARPETVLLRARNRAKVTGRHVPEETILESMRTIPESIRTLGPHAELVATFRNEDHEPEPRLRSCCMRERVGGKPLGEQCRSRLDLCAGSDGGGDCLQQAVVATTGDVGQGAVGDSSMRVLWTLREVYPEAANGRQRDRRGRGGPDCDGAWDPAMYQCGQGSSRMPGTKEGLQDSSCREVRRARLPLRSSQSGASSANGNLEGHCVTDRSGAGSKRRAEVALGPASSSAAASETVTVRVSPSPPSQASCPPSPSPGPSPASPASPAPQYLLEEQDGRETLLDDWKPAFAPIWEMKCALPARSSFPRQQGSSSEQADCVAWTQRDLAEPPR